MTPHPHRRRPAHGQDDALDVAAERAVIEIDMRGMTDGQADAALERAQSQRSPVTFHRPPVEKYVRVTVESRGFTMEPAVEWREGDDFYALTDRLDAIAGAASAIGWPHPMGAAEECGKRIAAWLPDRAYFVEVWHGERKGFAQVVQPFGVPRNRP